MREEDVFDKAVKGPKASDRRCLLLMSTPVKGQRLNDRTTLGDSGDGPKIARDTEIISLLLASEPAQVSRSSV